MLDFTQITPFILSSLVLSLAPGPDNIFVLTQSMVNGAKSGVLITLGLCSGLIFHTAAVAFGVASLIKASPVAFNILKYIGAAYLLKLAYGSFKASKITLASKAEKISYKKLYLRGIIMNITNPKVTIFFLAFLPQFINPIKGNVFNQTLLLGALFMICALGVFSALALLAGIIGEKFSNSEKAQIWLNRFASLVFIALSIKLLR